MNTRTTHRLLAWSAMSLILATAGCSELMPLPKDAPEGLLGGTSWQLQQLGSQGAIAGNQPTLVFGGTGSVSGTGSCNQYTGSVTINGKSIAFGPLATTQMACSDALNSQENSYLKALQDAQWFTVAGNTLTIYTKALEQPLVYLRAKPL